MADGTLCLMVYGWNTRSHGTIAGTLDLTVYYDGWGSRLGQQAGARDCTALIAIEMGGVPSLATENGS